MFSTEAPDCSSFNSRDPSQVETCALGEACLYYSWRKSARESSVIRECFPTSVLLGSIDQPVQPQAQCSPTSLESDSISACLCTSDLCNGVGEDDVNTELALVTTRRPRVAPTTTTTPPTTRRTTTRRRARPTRPRKSSNSVGNCHNSTTPQPDNVISRDHQEAPPDLPPGPAWPAVLQLWVPAELSQ